MACAALADAIFRMPWHQALASRAPARVSSFMKARTREIRGLRLDDEARAQARASRRRYANGLIRCSGPGAGCMAVMSPHDARAAAYNANRPPGPSRSFCHSRLRAAAALAAARRPPAAAPLEAWIRPAARLPRQNRITRDAEIRRQRIGLVPSRTARASSRLTRWRRQ